MSQPEVMAEVLVCGVREVKDEGSSVILHFRGVGAVSCLRSRHDLGSCKKAPALDALTARWMSLTSCLAAAVHELNAE